jgi:hypothetical protein
MRLSAANFQPSIIEKTPAWAETCAAGVFFDLIG